MKSYHKKVNMSSDTHYALRFVLSLNPTQIQFVYLSF